VTTRARDRKLVRDAAKLAERNQQLVKDNEALLDLMNAVLYAEGGKIVISRSQLIAADRRKLQVTTSKDGSIVIETEVREDADPRPITKQLWLPGQA
jgi:hypothetical protein